MSELKDLVPPLELCKIIPAGKFEDSALVYIYWWKSPTKAIEIRVRYEVESDPEFDDLFEDERIIIYPAPTLAEILEALYKMSGSAVKVSRRCERVGCWWGSAWSDRNRISRQDMNNPATAALRLWLEVNGVEVRNE